MSHNSERKSCGEDCGLLECPSKCARPDGHNPRDAHRCVSHLRVPAKGSIRGPKAIKLKVGHR